MLGVTLGVDAVFIATPVMLYFQRRFSFSNFPSPARVASHQPGGLLVPAPEHSVFRNISWPRGGKKNGAVVLTLLRDEAAFTPGGRTMIARGKRLLVKLFTADNLGLNTPAMPLTLAVLQG